MEHSAEYQLGYTIGENGKSIMSCPFPLESTPGTDWLMGWEQAILNSFSTTNKPFVSVLNSNIRR